MMESPHSQIQPDEGQRRLTDKERRFVEEYALSLNRTKAALKAGYSPKTARQIGQQLLSKLVIRKKVDEYLDEFSREKRDQIAATIRKLHLIRDFDPADVFDESGTIRPVSEWPESAKTALAGFDVAEIPNGAGSEEKSGIGFLKKVRFVNRDKAYELLLKYHGVLQPDTVPTTGVTVNVALVMKMAEDIRNGVTRIK